MVERNEIEYGDGFFRDAKQLPRKDGEKLATLLALLRNDAFHPLLHTKALAVRSKINILFVSRAIGARVLCLWDRGTSNSLSLITEVRYIKEWCDYEPRIEIARSPTEAYERRRTETLLGAVLSEVEGPR